MWEFSMGIFYRNFPWEFSIGILYGNFPREFSTGIFHRNFPWEEGSGISCGEANLSLELIPVPAFSMEAGGMGHFPGALSSPCHPILFPFPGFLGFNRAIPPQSFPARAGVSHRIVLIYL